MTEILAVLLDNSSLLVLWGALAMHWLLPIPTLLHPLRIWQQLAVLIADKVNKPDESRKQQLLSGSLAWSLMWLTVLPVTACRALSSMVWM